MEERGRSVVKVRRGDGFDRAFDRLESHLPGWLARMLDWLRAPERIWIRLPLGLAFLIGGLFWFLPVLGLEMLPIGLALLAVDILFLRRPIGRLLLWVDERWGRLEAWWRGGARPWPIRR